MEQEWKYIRRSMDRLLSEPKTTMALERQLQHIQHLILKRELARLVQEAQPEHAIVEAGDLIDKTTKKEILD